MKKFTILYLVFVAVAIYCVVKAMQVDQNVVKTEGEVGEKYESDYVDLTFLNGL